MVSNKNARSRWNHKKNINSRNNRSNRSYLNFRCCSSNLSKWFNREEDKPLLRRNLRVYTDQELYLFATMPQMRKLKIKNLGMTSQEIDNPILKTWCPFSNSKDRVLLVRMDQVGAPLGAQVWQNKSLIPGDTLSNHGTRLNLKRKRRRASLKSLLIFWVLEIKTNSLNLNLKLSSNFKSKA